MSRVLMGVASGLLSTWYELVYCNDNNNRVCTREKTVLIAATALMFQPTVPRWRRITFGRRAFSVAGPMVWNSLPTESRDLSVRFGDFGRTLKTILFARY